jgi:DNA-binding NarL/FixJ family response regulator
MEQQVAFNSVNREKFMSRKRILLADDHAEMLDEVRALLDGEYEIVGTAQDGRSLVEAAKELKPDLIVSDISMPEMTGFEAAAKIRAHGMDVKLIFLTVQSSAGYLRKARSLGADGYVLKVYTTEQLRSAVASVFSGTPYFSPQLATSELM